MWIQTIKVFGVILILLIGSLSTAQDAENPFSIIREKDKIKQELKFKKTTQNPFSIKHSEDSNIKTFDDTIVDNNSSLNPFKVNRNNSKKQVKKEKSNSNHKNGELKLENKSAESSQFVFWIIIFIFLLFAILINYKRPFILKSYRGILNENYLKLIKREENDGYSLFFVSLFIVFLLSFSVFIYLIILKNEDINIGFLGYIYITLILLVVYIIRWAIMTLLGYIFEIKPLIDKYFFIIIYYNILFGICLIAINVTFAFGNNIIALYSYYLGIIILISLLLIRYVRGLILSIQYNFLFKVHFIFYLCAVEIAPALVSLKILSIFTQ